MEDDEDLTFDEIIEFIEERLEDESGVEELDFDATDQF